MTLVNFKSSTDNFNERFQKFFDEFPFKATENGFSFYPKIDIFEDEKNIVIEAEVPGVKKDSMKISFENSILTISGEKKNERNENEGNKIYRSERSYGSFSRSFSLREEIDSNKIEARFEDGI